jgi:hypothetical protein
MQQHEAKASQLAPILEKPSHELKEANHLKEPAESPSEALQPRQHINRPSRLSAVLVPGPPAGCGAHSPPPSPPSSPSQARPSGLPNSSSSDGLSKLDRQVSVSAVIAQACPALASCFRASNYEVHRHAGGSTEQHADQGTTTDSKLAATQFPTSSTVTQEQDSSCRQQGCPSCTSSISTFDSHQQRHKQQRRR